MMEACSEKCVIRQFCPWVNTVECTYTKLDGLAYYTPGLCGMTYCPRLQAIVQNNKSSTNENDAIKRCSEHEMYEVAAGVYGILLHSKLFSKRLHSKMIKSIG